MPKPLSITAEKAAPNVWEIKGCTHPYKHVFLEHGCEWQGRKLLWTWQGDKLPTALQQLADGHYGLDALKTGVLAVEATTTPKTPETVIAPKPEQKAAAKTKAPKSEKKPRAPRTKKEAEPKKPAFPVAGKVTPLRQYYLDLKSGYKDCVFLFQLGEFFETFDEDAKKAADACDLVLTGRPVSKDVRVDMAGFPVHALDKYLPMLLKAGHKVAIAEQVHDAPADGPIVQRKVTRVLTPEGAQ